MKGNYRNISKAVSERAQSGHRAGSMPSVHIFIHGCDRG